MPDANALDPSTLMRDPVAQWLALQRAKNTAEGIGDDNLLAPTLAAARPIWSPDNSVGTSQLHDTYAGMPSPDVSPVIGAYGAHPVTAAMRANALNIASMASQFGPADMASIRAFHGSPYDFNAFDSSKIGTGEGAQAYGHGLYFAENEPTAKYYRDAVTAEQGRGHYWQDAGGNKVDIGSLSSLTGPQGFAASMLKQRGSVDEAIADVTRYGSDAFVGGKPEMDATLAGLQDMKARGLERVKDTGTMYEVSLNADPEHFLDWDKPLSEQSQHVRDALVQHGIGHGYQVVGPSGVVPEFHPTVDAAATAAKGVDGGTGIARADDIPGQLAYYRLAGKLTGNKSLSSPEAAHALHAAGIPGIKYLDQGSRSSGQGTSNYVIFDPKTIEILRKYGIAGLIAGGGAAATGTSSQNQQ